MIGIRLRSVERAKVEDSLAELAKLTNTAGGVVLDKTIQEVQTVNAAYLIGKGKVERIKDLIDTREADLVVFDNDLTPAQQRNLEMEFGVRVLDRTGLILDIFAQRARSKEGKLQVELAQLNYLLPRLAGKGSTLSRLGGGIGTRGPGETKLEVDRRKARDRISRIGKELDKVKSVRALHQKRRKAISCPYISIVGYTNAGKSTLLNRLADAGVLVEDKLFATLDPTIRKIRLTNGREVLLSDTVGFLNKLPHQLIAAFKATFEEVKGSDILVHVIDASHTSIDGQINSVNNVLKEIGVSMKPVIHVLNKVDKVDNPCEMSYRQRVLDNCVVISALTGEGIDDLLLKIEELTCPEVKRMKLRFPIEAGDMVSKIHRLGKVIKKEYSEGEVLVEAEIDKNLAQSLKGYSV